MLQYSYAPIGKQFVLTELGFEQSQIRSKFEETSSLRKTVEITVPCEWVEKGYVRLVGVMQ